MAAAQGRMVARGAGRLQAQGPGVMLAPGTRGRLGSGVPGTPERLGVGEVRGRQADRAAAGPMVVMAAGEAGEAEEHSVRMLGHPIAFS
jgi:hypothetical protein